MSTSRTTPYPLRLKPELRKVFEEMASNSGRSLNAEITFCLNQYLDITGFISDSHQKYIDSLSPEEKRLHDDQSELLRPLRESIYFEANQEFSTKVIKLKNKRRVVYGTMLNTLDIDYSKKLKELSDDVKFFLDFFRLSDSFSPYIGEDVILYQGGNHIDIVRDGKGSMGWITIEDHTI